MTVVESVIAVIGEVLAIAVASVIEEALAIAVVLVTVVELEIVAIAVVSAIDPALEGIAVEPVAIASGTVVYPAVHAAWVGVSDATTEAAVQVHAPAATVAHRAWAVSEEVAGARVEVVGALVVVAAAEAEDLVAAAVVAAAAAVAVGAEAEGGKQQ